MGIFSHYVRYFPSDPLWQIRGTPEEEVQWWLSRGTFSVAINVGAFANDAGRLYPRTTTCQWQLPIWMNMTRLLMLAGIRQRPQERNWRSWHRTISRSYCWHLSSFPCVLPFSQMYPLCCIDIRNFLNQFYFFSDDHFQEPHIIDETLQKVCMLSLGVVPWLTRATVTRWASFRESMPHSSWTPKLSIPRANSPNLNQPRTFWNCLSRARKTPHCSTFLYVRGRSHCPECNWRVPGQ